MKPVALSRIVLRVSLGVALLVYLVIVDLGVNAGRIHYGIELSGDQQLGGLTREQAVARLTKRVALLGSQPLVFVARDIRVRVSTDDRNWEQRVARTVRSAFRLGREGAPFGALWDRLRAWVGLRLRLEGRPKLARTIASVESDVSQHGVELDTVKFARKIRRLLVTWPRRDRYRLPLTG